MPPTTGQAWGKQHTTHLQRAPQVGRDDDRRGRDARRRVAAQDRDVERQPAGRRAPRRVTDIPVVTTPRHASRSCLSTTPRNPRVASRASSPDARRRRRRPRRRRRRPRRQDDGRRVAAEAARHRHRPAQRRRNHERREAQRRQRGVRLAAATERRRRRRRRLHAQAVALARLYVCLHFSLCGTRAQNRFRHLDLTWMDARCE